MPRFWSVAFTQRFQRGSISCWPDMYLPLKRKSSWTNAADLVLLDPGEPDGYVRNWSAPGFPPMRHIGYAVQWFALALTLLVIYVVTNLRRNPEVPA